MTLTVHAPVDTDEITATTRRRIVVMVVASFTPYLGVGLNIRYEHLIIYSMILLVVLASLNRRSLALNKLSFQLLSAWLGLGSLVVLNTVFRARTGVGTVDPLAIADSFLLPMAFFVLAFITARNARSSVTGVLNVATMAIVIMLCINSLVILLFDVEDIRETLRLFWSNPATTLTGRSVAEMALLGGRYGGIFNQPFDGGVAYTIGIIAWTYRFRSASRSGGLLQLGGVVTLTLLIAGGVSTQSKAFVYGSIMAVALALIIGGAGSLNRFFRIARQVSFGVLAISAAGWFGLVESFDRTIDFIFAFQEDPDDRNTGIYGVTGGRSESVADYTERLGAQFSLSGVGWSGPQDDALRAYISGGGLIGVALFVLAIGALLGIARGQALQSPERLLAFSLAIFIVAASFGAVSLQINRGSSMFWLLMGILAAGIDEQQRQSAAPSPPALPPRRLTRA